MVEDLETRRTPSTLAAAPPPTIPTLKAFTQHYPSRLGNPRYSPTFDLNQNRQVGQVDGKILLRRLQPVTPRVPLTLNLHLAPGDQARGHVPTNLGGVTHRREVTVLGHTSPGALIFTGNGTIDVKLRGPAFVADAQGNFQVPFTNRDGINQFDVLAVDRDGHQVLRAFPILWLDFAAYEDAHPQRT